MTAAARTRAVVRVVGCGIVASAASLLAPAPGNARSIQTVATEVRETPLSAYGDVLVWSSFDPQTERYVLKSHHRGRVDTLRVRPRRIPFDVDVGPGPDGAVNVVYSRCADESRERDVRRGCRLWRYSLREQRERSVRGSRRSGYSEFSPTIWGKRIAFARVRRTGQRVPGLAVRALSSRRARPVRVADTYLAQNAAYIYVGQLDLRGTQLLSSWIYQETECRSGVPGKVGDAGGEIFVGSVRVVRRLISGCDRDEPYDVRDATWVGASISAIVLLVDKQSSSFAFDRRIRLYSPEGELKEDTDEPRSAFELARTPAALYYTQPQSGQDGPPGGPYDIIRSATP